MMLGHLHDDRAVQPLIAALSDESPAVQRSAAVALERLNPPLAADVLTRWHRDHPFSAQERFEHYLAEYSLYGETEAYVLLRLTKLANQKRVSVEEIIKAYALRELGVALPPLIYQRLTMVTLSEAEYAFLEQG